MWLLISNCFALSIQTVKEYKSLGENQYVSLKTDIPVSSKLTICCYLLVPTPGNQQPCFDPFVLEKWPLIQAFALEGFGR